MTSTEVIKRFRPRIRRLIPSETFQDPYLWAELMMARSRVYRNNLTSRTIINRQAYHTVCLELIDNPDDCCNIKNCSVKRTKHKLPSYITNKTRSTLSIKGKQKIDLYNIDQLESNIKYIPGMDKREVGSLENGYLYLVNSDSKDIKVSAIWTNPLDLLFIQKCNDNNCLRDNAELMQITEEQLLDIFNIAQASILSTQMPSDNTGDNNEQV